MNCLDFEVKGSKVKVAERPHIVMYALWNEFAHLSILMKLVSLLGPHYT